MVWNKGAIAKLTMAYFKIKTMFLNLNHQKLNAYKQSVHFTVECYRFTRSLPAEERFNLIQQIMRAAISVHLNLAEGCSRKSNTERNRFFEIPRGSIVEIDAALDVSLALDYCSKSSLTPLGESMVECFKSLSSLIKSSSKPD